MRKKGFNQNCPTAKNANILASKALLGGGGERGTHDRMLTSGLFLYVLLYQQKLTKFAVLVLIYGHI